MLPLHGTYGQSTENNHDKYFFSQGSLEAIEKSKALVDADKELVSERDLIILRYDALKRAHLKKAITIFQLAIYGFQEVFNLYAGLEEVHMKNGNSALATKNYKKSIELNPENQNRIDMLKALRAQ